MSGRRSLPRRTAVGVAALAPLALAGCELDPPRDPAAPSTSAAPAPADDDAGLVREVVAALDGAAATVAAAAPAAPGAAAALAALAALHGTHRTLLEEALPDDEQSAATAPSPSAPTDEQAALRAVRAAERQLSRSLLDACLTARSGDLARVLASAHAGVAQHVAGLPTAGPAR